jgi:hypothetical protein
VDEVETSRQVLQFPDDALSPRRHIRVPRSSVCLCECLGKASRQSKKLKRSRSQR